MDNLEKEFSKKKSDIVKHLDSMEEDARVILEYFNQNNDDWEWIPGEKWPTGGCVLEAFRAASILTSISRIRKAIIE